MIVKSPGPHRGVVPLAALFEHIHYIILTHSVPGPVSLLIEEAKAELTAKGNHQWNKKKTHAARIGVTRCVAIHSRDNEA